MAEDGKSTKRSLDKSSSREPLFRASRALLEVRDLCALGAGLGSNLRRSIVSRRSLVIWSISFNPPKALPLSSELGLSATRECRLACTVASRSSPGTGVSN